ncbi:MAG: tetratricopeptide repeat protein, partial [bacterium]
MNILFFIFLFTASPARAGEIKVQPEEDLFQASAQLYQQASADKAAAIEAFEKFVERYSKSSKAADARFMIGEAHISRALELLRAERSAKRASEARMMGGQNPTASSELARAAESFEKVIKRYGRSGLESSAQYRLGEISYNHSSWAQAVKAFKEVEDKYPKSYLVPESLIGIVYADLAMNNYAGAETAFFH